LDWFAVGCLAGTTLGICGLGTPLLVSTPEVKNTAILYNMTPQARMSYEECYRKRGKEKLQAAALYGALTGVLMTSLLVLVMTLFGS